MDFDALLAQVRDLLQRQERLSYRALRLRFQLDDASLAALKDELIYAERVARDEEDRVLVWVEKAGTAAEPANQFFPPLPSETALTKPYVPEAERRQLTVLFCDLVDSTAMASRLDPEEWREVVRAYQTTCAEVIARYEGHIAQLLGDGLLVYFSYPRAHEDDARRAIHTGLGMVEAIATLNTRLGPEHGIRLAVRIGIHTGLVVVGEMGGSGRQERLALGETPNIAARIQGTAAPDTVAVSAATFRLVQGVFAAEDMGTRLLKGMATPVKVYRVLGDHEARSRLDVVGTRGLTPLVGRELEVTLLLERWAQVQEGMGQVVVLSGEPGIGKSRLVEVLKAHIAAAPHTRLECRGSPYHQHSALYPVIELLQRALAFATEDTPDDKVCKLETALSRAHLDLQDTVPLLATLLSLPRPDRYAPLSLTPQRQRQKTLEALLGLVLALAAQHPVLCIVEDLHWVDPSTLEVLTLLIDQGPTARLFTLCTCRPEFRAPWGRRGYLTPITLNRLPRRQVELLVERVAGGKALPATVVQEVVTKTDGVPLFVEELTKMLLESGMLREEEDRYTLTDVLPPLAIPTTLHDSLMARLDRLADAKAVAQLGATLGRAFSYELLQAVSSLDEARLQQALARLVEAELLYQQGLPPQAMYLFKHALIQDVAYQSLLKRTRQQYHQQIAHVLETQLPETAETQPELLAHHYTEAGLTDEAITYWQRAGARALEHSAHVETISHLSRGLALLKILPETPARLQQELSLYITLGPALIATRGQAAPEVEHTYVRARELCRQVGDTPQLFPALWGLSRFYLVRPDLKTAREIGEQLLCLAQCAEDPALRLETHRTLGTTFLELGAFAPARVHLEEGIALYDRQQYRAHTFLYARDPGVVCLSYAAQVMWLLGYPDQARQRLDDALRLAEQLSHPFSVASVLFYAAILHQLCREVRAAQERTEALLTLAAEHEFAQRIANALIIHGWALVKQGRGNEGMAEMRQGLTAYAATGAELTRPYFLGLLGEGYGVLGQAAEGLRLLAEALATVNQHGERFYEAELYRLKGELLLTGSVEPHAEALACYHQALAIARDQRAKSLELRAALSLSRLWQRQGKRANARQLLAKICDWFTEGFDTADLQEAAVLLEELS